MSFAPFEADASLEVGSDGQAELFAYEIRHSGRVVVALRGIQQTDDTVVVEADVFPIGPDSGSGLRRPFAFTTRERALAFVDESLRSLEFLACTVT